MRAKEYLQQINKLDRLINNKLIEIEQWKDIAQSTTGNSDGERVQSSGQSQDKMADAVCKYLSIEEQINADVDDLIDTKQDVIRTIEQLSVTEYDVLHMIYIQFKTLYDVADKYTKSYTWVTTVHGRALANVQKILDGRGKI